jgi:hypothetical protein
VKSNYNSSSVVSLAKARQDRPVVLPYGTLCPPWAIYDPPARYSPSPCQVIVLQVVAPQFPPAINVER